MAAGQLPVRVQQRSGRDELRRRDIAERKSHTERSGA
jgi:hypothetical protein